MGDGVLAGTSDTSDFQASLINLAGISHVQFWKLRMCLKTGPTRCLACRFTFQTTYGMFNFRTLQHIYIYIYLTPLFPFDHFQVETLLDFILNDSPQHGFSEEPTGNAWLENTNL